MNYSASAKLNSSPYGLTGYSQPNPLLYRPYSEYKNEVMKSNNNNNTDLKSKSAFETIGYNRFDYGN